MKILFIYPNLGGAIGFNIGISILSSILKQKNHEVRLIHLNESMGFPLDLERIKKIILDYQPDLIGFSVTTNQFSISLKIAKFIKEKIDSKIPILFGGVHPTLNPEETLRENCVDLVGVGEGERLILELVERLKNKEDISNLNNLWLKKDGKIVKNRLSGFINLNEVPFVDVAIWDYQKLIDLRNGWIDLVLNRGCPFNCTYCFNEPYKRIYSKYCDEKNSYMRAGNYAKTIEGIKQIMKNYKNVKCIHFVEDDFLFYPSIVEFIKSFKKEINLPFVLATHLNSVNDIKMEALKNGGCDLVRVGLESGNEHLRKEILNRHMSNEQIIEKMKLIKKYGLRTSTYNMVGIPGEKKEDVIKTIKLNLECGTDVVKFSIFYPYPGTEIYEKCKEMGLLTENPEESLTYYDKSILNFDEEFKLFIEKFQKNFDCYLNYHDEKLSAEYKPIVDFLDGLSREKWDNAEIHKKIQEMKDLKSRELSSKRIPHYEMKFTSYFAVKV